MTRRKIPVYSDRGKKYEWVGNEFGSKCKGCKEELDHTEKYQEYCWLCRAVRQLRR